MSCLSEASTVSQHSIQPSAASAAAAVHSKQPSRAAAGAATGGSRVIKGPQELAALRQQFATELDAFMTSARTEDSDEETEADDADPPTSKKGMRYRGVTRHKRTQRFEAHIWESKKQIYLGGFDSEVLAAKSHDVMALRCKGTGTELLNFPLEQYKGLAALIEKLSRDDVINALRTFSKSQTISKKGGSSAVGVKSGGVHKVSGAAHNTSRHVVPSAPTLRRLTIPACRATAQREQPAGASTDSVPVAGRNGLASPAVHTAHPAGEQGESSTPRSNTGKVHPSTPHPPAPYTPTAAMAAARPGASRALLRLRQRCETPRAESQGPGLPAEEPAPICRVLSGHSAAAGAPADFCGQEAQGLVVPSHQQYQYQQYQQFEQYHQRQQWPAQQHADPSGMAWLPSTPAVAAGVPMSGRLGLGLISPFSSQEVTPAGTVAMNAPGAHNSARAAITAAAAAARQQQHCQEQLQGQRACQPADAHSALDEIDLDGILGMLVGGGNPVEEPSLTFSAGEEGRLYEWTAVDSAHSGLEHMRTGAVLFQSPEQQEEHRRAAASLSQDFSAGTIFSDALHTPCWAPYNLPQQQCSAAAPFQYEPGSLFFM